MRGAGARVLSAAPWSWILAAVVLCGSGGCGGGTVDPRGAVESARRASVLRFWDAMHRATEARRAGDPGTAVAAYREALAIDPHHEDALYYLGHCLAAEGRQSEAGVAFGRLVEVNPRSARGHAALGAILAAPRDATAPDLAGAEREFTRAHEINKEETGPMVRLGEIRLVLGDLEGAGFWLRSALATNPKSVEAAFLDGYLRWRAGDLDAAVQVLTAARRSGAPGAPAPKVVGEGDHAPAVPATAGPDTGSGRAVAPPVEQPNGETLFGDLAARLRTPPASAGSSSATAADHLDRQGLDRLFRTMDARLGSIRERAQASPGAAAATRGPALPHDDDARRGGRP